MLKSLAKSHAYALVGCSQGATAILQSARQKPSLSNFVVVRTPFNTGSNVHQFSGLLHPTLVFADGCAKGPWEASNPVNCVCRMPRPQPP